MKDNVVEKKTVCISSVYSREENFVDYRFTAAKVVEKLGLMPYRNPENKGSTQLKFEKTLKEDDPIFVLIIGNVDSSVVKRECQIALDSGLKIITFIKTEEDKKIFEESTRILSEISKITYSNECSLFCNCEELSNALEERINSYLIDNQSKKVLFKFDETIVYDTAKELIDTAKRRIILCQKTSSLILGPKKGRIHEKIFYNILMKWLKEGDKQMELIHIFSLPKTKEKLKEGTDYDIQVAKEALETLIEGKLQVNLIFRAIDSNCVAFIIADRDILFHLEMGKYKCNAHLPGCLTDSSQVQDIISQTYNLGEVAYQSEGDEFCKLMEVYNNN